MGSSYLLSSEYVVYDIPFVILSCSSSKNLLLIDTYLPYFYVNKNLDSNELSKLLSKYPHKIEETDKVNFSREGLKKIVTNHPKNVKDMRELLLEYDIPSYESDIRFTKRYKMDKDIYSFFKADYKKQDDFNEENIKNRLNNNLEFIEQFNIKESVQKLKQYLRTYYDSYDYEFGFFPEFSETDYKNHEFGLLSFDIETIEDEIVLLSSVYSDYNFENSVDNIKTKQYVLKNKKNKFKEPDDNIKLKNYEIKSVERSYFDNEKEMLKKFFKDFKKEDPDLITGWNVVDFDLDFLEKRFKHHRIDFEFSRKNERSGLRRYSNFFKRSKAYFFGRNVLDGIFLLKDNFVKLDNYKLTTASIELLGDDKVDIVDDKLGKYDSIKKEWRDGSSKVLFYNVKDSALVIDILLDVKVLQLTLLRTHITGLSLNNINSSIQVLDSLYIRDANKEGVVCDNIRHDAVSKSVSGGFVLDPDKGIFENICVYDFKSLYPSLILTYNLDPFSFFGTIDNPSDEIKEEVDDYVDKVSKKVEVKLNNQKIETKKDLIKQLDNPNIYFDKEIDFFFEKENQTYIISSNGAIFSQGKSFLKDLINKIWSLRDKAKEENDDVKSYALKIILNSFSGVLGNSTCRFYNPKVIGSITSFGRLTIKITKNFIEKGSKEISGKVLYGDTDSVFVDLNLESNKSLYNDAKKHGRIINKYHDNRIKDTYNIKSKLELEFEKLYEKFLLLGVKKRYAGLINYEDGSKEIDIVGLETVRSDWTKIAREVQRNFLEKLFYDEDYKTYLKKVVKELRGGEYDDKLVYKKHLSKPLSEYKKTTPPHVKAARMLDELNTNVVEYLMTVDGPQPKSMVKSSLDYDHYIEKQIKAVVDNILNSIGLNFNDIIKGTEQKTLSSF
ncbi:MAG: DNA polymerase domain-containing protein [Candidatus Woesearchaeota archaeon]